MGVKKAQPKGHDMGSKHLLPATLAALLLAGGGIAQAQTVGTGLDPTGLHEAEDDAALVPGLEMSVDDLEDMELVGANGEEIGEVEEVLADSSEQPAAVVVEAGGFLGIGEKSVLIGLDRLTLTGDRLVTQMTKEEIEALPEWEMED